MNHTIRNYMRELQAKSVKARFKGKTKEQIGETMREVAKKGWVKRKAKSNPKPRKEKRGRKDD